MDEDDSDAIIPDASVATASTCDVPLPSFAWSRACPSAPIYRCSHGFFKKAPRDGDHDEDSLDTAPTKSRFLHADLRSSHTDIHWIPPSLAVVGKSCRLLEILRRVNHDHSPRAHRGFDTGGYEALQEISPGRRARSATAASWFSASWPGARNPHRERLPYPSPHLPVLQSTCQTYRRASSLSYTMRLLGSITLLASLVAVATALIEPQHECNNRGEGCARDCSPTSPDGLQHERWDFLNMTGHNSEWVAEHGTEAGMKELGFAQASLVWSHRGGETGNLITGDTCDAHPADGEYQNAQQSYTLSNIFAVCQFFNQFSEALTTGQSLASSRLGQIVDKGAPAVEHVVGTPKWYTAFATALFFAGGRQSHVRRTRVADSCGPFVAAPASLVTPEGAVVAALVINGLWAARSTPPLGYTSRTYAQPAEARFTALAHVGADLGGLTAGYLSILLEEGETMQDDAPGAVIALCSPGGSSSRVTIPLTDQSLEIYSTSEYVVLGEALTASGIVIAQSPGIDPRTVPKIDCKELGPRGDCGNFSYHHGNTYSGHDPKASRDCTSLIESILDAGFVTDLADVFAIEGCHGKGPTRDVAPPDWKQTCLMSPKRCDASKCSSDRNKIIWPRKTFRQTASVADEKSPSTVYDDSFDRQRLKRVFQLP